jgi:hypothetical protein
VVEEVKRRAGSEEKRKKEKEGLLNPLPTYPRKEGRCES